jgi:general secretion pathway protein D
MPKSRKAFFIVLSLVLLVGCMTLRETRMGDQFMSDENWEGAVFAYQEAVKKDPTNLDLRKKLEEAKVKAAEAHFSKGQQLLKKDKLSEALEELKRAILLDPAKGEYLSVLNRVLRRQQANERVAVGLRLMNAGKFSDALDEFGKALELVPGYPLAEEALAKLSEKRREAKSEEEELTLKSNQPITLKFQNAKLKDVFELLSKTTGINILFDKDVRDENISIFIKDASFREVLSLILATNNLFMKKISEDTILIIPKLPQKLNQYQDLMIQTFYLSNIKAKDMVNLLRTMLETKRIFVNEELNAIIIRDTPDKMKLAEKIINANDRNPAEVMFEIEILEVDKTKSLKYGWNFNPASATFGLTPNPITLTQLKAIGTDSYLFTLPSIIVDFMKQESDAKTLANPKIRVVDNKTAKVSIGDKFPILLSTSTFSPTGTSVTTPGAVSTPAGTSIATNVEYKDVGIRLTVEPNIHLNNDVTLKLNLEVSSLGNQVNLGNGTTQYEFGERDAATVLTMRDGETVIIGGMIRDEDRTAVTKVPGLGDVPVLGKLFSDTDKGKITTDIVLTITPHVVRALETPGKEDQAFWSGTEETYSTKPLFSELPTVGEVKESPPSPAPQPQSQPPSPPTSPPAVLTLRPSEATASLNQEVTLAAEIQNAKDLNEAIVSLSYDPKVLEFKRAVEGPFMRGDGQKTAFVTSTNPASGLINLRIRRVANNGGAKGSGTLFDLSFASKTVGSSAILFQPGHFLGPAREPLSVSFVSGRIIVK